MLIPHLCLRLGGGPLQLFNRRRPAHLLCTSPLSLDASRRNKSAAKASTSTATKSARSPERPAQTSAQIADEAATIAKLQQLFELRNPTEVLQLLGTTNSKYVLTTKAEDLQMSYDQLLAMGQPKEDIRRAPKVLAKNALTIYNHTHVLNEIAFQPVNVAALNKYISITNQSVERLQELQLIQEGANVPQRLADVLKIELSAHRDYDTAGKIRELRRAVLNTFLSAQFDLSQAELDRIWSTYSNLRHKSFASIRDAVHVCRDVLGMDSERIKQHPYVLYADPENVRQIVAQGTLGGIDAKQLLWRRPKIAMTNWRNLLRVQQVIREFGVPDAAFTRCVEIFTLGPETIRERLEDLRKVREFDVLVEHPRVLRLVHYQMKARARLEYLRKMKVNCVSLHVLSAGSTSFERYARTGVDRTKGVDIVMLLKQRLALEGGDVLELRAKLNRHPNWCHVPAVSVKQVLDSLELEHGFTRDCIYANVHILLYPLQRIRQQFVVLEDSKARWGIEPHKLTPMQRLQMCLYLIELEFHFEGDGIWMEPLHEHQSHHSPTAASFVGGESEFELIGDYKKNLGRICGDEEASEDVDECSEEIGIEETRTVRKSSSGAVRSLEA